jgi:hypothetical protein
VGILLRVTTDPESRRTYKLQEKINQACSEDFQEGNLLRSTIFKEVLSGQAIERGRALPLFLNPTLICQSELYPIFKNGSFPRTPFASIKQLQLLLKDLQHHGFNWQQNHLSFFVDHLDHGLLNNSFCATSAKKFHQQFLERYPLEQERLQAYEALSAGYEALIQQKRPAPSLPNAESGAREQSTSQPSSLIDLTASEDEEEGIDTLIIFEEEKNDASKPEKSFELLSHTYSKQQEKKELEEHMRSLLEEAPARPLSSEWGEAQHPADTYKAFEKELLTWVENFVETATEQELNQHALLIQQFVEKRCISLPSGIDINLLINKMTSRALQLFLEKRKANRNQPKPDQSGQRGSISNRSGNTRNNLKYKVIQNIAQTVQETLTASGVLVQSQTDLQTLSQIESAYKPRQMPLGSFMRPQKRALAYVERPESEKSGPAEKRAKPSIESKAKKRPPANPFKREEKIKELSRQPKKDLEASIDDLTHKLPESRAQLELYQEALRLKERAFETLRKRGLGHLIRE